MHAIVPALHATRSSSVPLRPQESSVHRDVTLGAAKGGFVQELLIFVIAGLSAGAVYALAGVGLVLTYRTSGVFNFAHGALATVAAYCFFTLLVTHGRPWAWAASVSIVVVGTVMGLLLEPFARIIRLAGLAMQVAGTVGLLLAIQAIVALIYPDENLRQVPQFLPSGGFELAGTPVQWSDVITVAFALLVTVVLTLALRYTRAGLTTRALVDDDQLLSLNAISPPTVRRAAWIAGSILASASGVLFAPLLPLNSVQLTLLVVAAFGAAAVGGFRSLAFTFVGGLVIGVLASLTTRYVTQPAFVGLAPSLPFVVLFLVILLRRRGTAYMRTAVNRIESNWSAPAPLQLGLGVAVLVALALVPSWAGIDLDEWIAALGTVVLFLSLALLVRTSGQVSLCHVAFTAIGACGFSHLMTGAGLPWALALIVGGLIAVPVGAVLAIPAIRLSGLYLALATFGFGILLQYMFYTRGFMFGSSGNPLPMPRPSFGGSNQMGDTAFYYLVLGILLLAAIAVIALTRSRLGRLLRGMSDAATALETTGASVTVTRVLVFCLSAFLAAVAGALIGAARTTVSVVSYPPLLSLTYFALIIIVIGREPWNALLAGLSLILIPAYVSGGHVSLYLQLLFGASAVLTAMRPPNAVGPPMAVRRWIDRAVRRAPARGTPEQLPRAAVAAAARIGSSRTIDGGPGLRVHNLTVRFGGVVALDSVDLDIPVGRITGLIGPNGAGKTTLVNACTGLVRPSGGSIELGGRQLTRLRTGARARRGLGRTFQDMHLFESMTVRQNIALGREGSYAGLNPFSH